MKKVLLILSAAVIFFIPSGSDAVNFYDGVRAPEGLYLLTYTSLYTADEVTDGSGDTAVADYGFTRIQEMLRLSYYAKEMCFHVYLPAGYKEVEYYGEDTWGWGDLNLGIGRFLPVKSLDIVPMLFVKFPTGRYDGDRKVNYGDHQFDIKPTVFLHKTIRQWTVDLALKYFYRLVNPDTHTAPHNEFYAEALLGYEFWNFMKVGLSLNWMKSDDSKYFGEEVANNAKVRESYSIGSDIYFRLSSFNLSFTYLYDVYVENTVKGHYVQMKTVHRF